MNSMSAISIITQKTAELFSKLEAQPYSQLILAALPASVCALLLPAAYRDYQAYLALGPGGPPHNVAGWLIVKLVFNPLMREGLKTDIYDRKIDDGENVDFIEDLSRRKSERPATGSFALPQRQKNQQPSQEIRDVCPCYKRKKLMSRNS